MKKAKNDQADEKRAKTLNDICVSVKNTFAHEALINKLSPCEMIAVMVTLSYHLCSKISKHFDVALSTLIENFNEGMNGLLEDNK